jgi:hypothetical protein
MYTAVANLDQWRSIFGVDVEHIEQYDVVRYSERVDDGRVNAALRWLEERVGSIKYDGKALTLFADDDFKLKQVADVLVAKLAKRGVDIRALEYKDPEKISGNKMKQAVIARTGVDQERAKKIVKMLKDSKLKVQGSIQGDAVRVSGSKKDDLQAAIALVRKSVTDYPLQYENFRD